MPTLETTSLALHLPRFTNRLRVSALALLGLVACSREPEQLPPDLDLLLGGLSSAVRVDYRGDSDGGLSHVNYFTIKPGTPEFAALPKIEQDKLTKIQSSILHSAKLPPTDLVAGTEITGTLTVHDVASDRTQELVLKVPKNWNGQLVVAGTPGTRSEFASEAVLATWLLRRGFAYVAGNKGMTNGGSDGNTSLLRKRHATQYWGVMMLDLATWARERLLLAMNQAPTRIYAVGLSNGGYQVRRALEIDHELVGKGLPRLFAGGIEWAGVYWPDATVLDASKDGKVTPSEFAQATHLVSSMERAALAMGFPYDAGALTTPQAYAQNPPFAAAHGSLVAAGFRPASAILWGAYSLLFDALKAKLPVWRGVGYYNLTAYYYRADLLGHDEKDSAPYAMWSLSETGHPAFYDYVASAPQGGWTQESVDYALRNATTGRISAPLISLHGDRDALIGLSGNGDAYDAAIRAAGQGAFHRLYTIANGNHVDAHADGLLDYDCNSKPGDEGAADLLVPMQPYVERAFDLLGEWVEKGQAPPASHVVATDPKNDLLDAKQISF
jgi:hypothetical protein